MQEINLLSDELIPRHDPFTLRLFIAVWGFVVLSLCVVSGWQVYTASRINIEVSEARERLLVVETDVRELKAQTLRQADPDLLKELALLTKQRDNYMKLGKALRGESLSNGFYDYLHDLATTHMRQLWFDTIEISHGGKHILLGGFSESAELVPLYLSMLSRGNAFAGYNFDGMEIKRETDVLVSFEVRGPSDESTQ